MRKFVLFVACSLPLGALAAGAAPFIDESKRIPAEREWNREIVARVSGSIHCSIASGAGISVTLIADRSYQAVVKGSPSGMVREDLILTSDHPDGKFDQVIAIPSAGSYWFIIGNLSPKPQKLSLSCRKWEEASSENGGQ